MAVEYGGADCASELPPSQDIHSLCKQVETQLLEYLEENWAQHFAPIIGRFVFGRSGRHLWNGTDIDLLEGCEVVHSKMTAQNAPEYTAFYNSKIHGDRSKYCEYFVANVFNTKVSMRMPYVVPDGVARELMRTYNSQSGWYLGKLDSVTTTTYEDGCLLEIYLNNTWSAFEVDADKFFKDYPTKKMLFSKLFNE